MCIKSDPREEQIYRCFIFPGVLTREARNILSPLILFYSVWLRGQCPWISLHLHSGLEVEKLRSICGNYPWMFFEGGQDGRHFVVNHKRGEGHLKILEIIEIWNHFMWNVETYLWCQLHKCDIQHSNYMLWIWRLEETDSYLTVHITQS